MLWTCQTFNWKIRNAIGKNRPGQGKLEKDQNLIKLAEKLPGKLVKIKRITKNKKWINPLKWSTKQKVPKVDWWYR